MTPTVSDYVRSGSPRCSESEGSDYDACPPRLNQSEPGRPLDQGELIGDRYTVEFSFGKDRGPEAGWNFHLGRIEARRLGGIFIWDGSIHFNWHCEKNVKWRCWIVVQRIPIQDYRFVMVRSRRSSGLR